MDKKPDWEITSGRFAATPYVGARHSETGEEWYRVALSFDTKRGGSTTLHYDERELSNLPRAVMLGLRRSGSVERLDERDMQALKELGPEVRNVIDNYLKRGRSIEEWTQDRGITESPRQPPREVYRFTNGERTAAVHVVGMRDGKPQVWPELRDNRSGERIPLTHEQAAGLLDEIQSLSRFTRRIAQEHEQSQEVKPQRTRAEAKPERREPLEERPREGNPTNRDFAQRFRSAVMQKYDDEPELVRDVLADARHFCEQNGIDFEDELRKSRMHFETERETEQPSRAESEQKGQERSEELAEKPKMGPKLKL